MSVSLLLFLVLLYGVVSFWLRLVVKAYKVNGYFLSTQAEQLFDN